MYEEVETVTENVIENVVSSGAVEIMSTNLIKLYEVCYSIRIILLAFAIWLIICTLYKFFNMFF